MDYDFCGWATKNDLKCADGLTIRKGAFKINDGQKVPLIWNHQHNSVEDVLGHAWLENRPEGVYAYGKFNNTPNGQNAKEAVRNGDVVAMSIFANNLRKDGRDVLHGAIREVSLVLAGANPGAFIESVIYHGMPLDEDDEEGVFFTGEPIELYHADEDEEDDDMEDEKTIGELFDELTDEQKEMVYAVVGAAMEDDEDDEDEDDEEDEEEEDDDMKHNIFDDEDQGGEVLTHAMQQQILADAKRLGSLKEAIKQNLTDEGVIFHSIDTTGMETATGTQTYGFNDVSMLYPEFKNLNNPPEWISRNMDWVSNVIGGVHRTPYSRIRSTYADITEDEARAKGYIKGKQKKEEVFTTLKRTTTPQTVYKLQKMDRDDIIDITDFDVVAWIRAEMRVMLNEEIARAILIGDGRPSDSEFKIQEDHIRPIVKDVPLFNVRVPVKYSGNQSQAEDQVDAIIRARKKYKGSGNPTFFTTEDVLTEMLMIKDKIGHRIYKTETELATALRVRSIVTVEVMEGYKVEIDKADKPLIGVMVNLNDYNVGTDKGGQIENFSDFDIQYNQYRYLIETRMSGALVKPFSALTIYDDSTTTSSGGTGTGTGTGTQTQSF